MQQKIQQKPFYPEFQSFPVNFSRNATQLQLKFEEKQGQVPKIVENLLMNNQDNQRLVKHNSNKKNIRIKDIINTNKNNNHQIEQIDYNNNPNQPNNYFQSQQLQLQKSLPDIRKQHIVFPNKNQNQRNTDYILNHNNNNDIFQSNLQQRMPKCSKCNLIIPGEITQLQCLCNYHGSCFDEIVNKQLDQNNQQIVCARCSKPIQNQFLNQTQIDKLEKVQRMQRSIRQRP